MIVEAAQLAAQATTGRPGGDRYGCHGRPPTGSRTLILTSTDVPSGRIAPPLLTAMRTGTSCVTLVKFPAVLPEGRSENVAALAGVIASTRPGKV